MPWSTLVPSPYSITSSARARSDGGMVRPRAMAVLRLTRSKRVGFSTGISPGFAPRRILSTYSAARWVLPRTGDTSYRLHGANWREHLSLAVGEVPLAERPAAPGTRRHSVTRAKVAADRVLRNHNDERRRSLCSTASDPPRRRRVGR